MNRILDPKAMEPMVRRSLGDEVRVYAHQARSDALLVDTPFYGRDGDAYTVLMTNPRDGVTRLSDGGSTLMRLSYTVNTDPITKGRARRFLDDALAAAEAHMDSGCFVIDCPTDKVGDGLFRLGQLITRVDDLHVLCRRRRRGAVGEELAHAILRIVPPEITEIEAIDHRFIDADLHPIDVRLRADVPVFLFDIPNVDKARLATIHLQHFSSERQNHPFRSIVVLETEHLPPSDKTRLRNAADATVPGADRDRELRKQLIDCGVPVAA